MLITLASQDCFAFLPCLLSFDKTADDLFHVAIGREFMHGRSQGESFVFKEEGDSAIRQHYKNVAWRICSLRYSS